MRQSIQLWITNLAKEIYRIDKESEDSRLKRPEANIFSISISHSYLHEFDDGKIHAKFIGVDYPAGDRFLCNLIGMLVFPNDLIAFDGNGDTILVFVWDMQREIQNNECQCCTYVLWKIGDLTATSQICSMLSLPIIIKNDCASFTNRNRNLSNWHLNIVSWTMIWIAVEIPKKYTQTRSFHQFNVYHHHLNAILICYFSKLVKRLRRINDQFMSWEMGDETIIYVTKTRKLKCAPQKLKLYLKLGSSVLLLFLLSCVSIILKFSIRIITFFRFCTNLTNRTKCLHLNKYFNLIIESCLLIL